MSRNDAGPRSHAPRARSVTPIAVTAVLHVLCASPGHASPAPDAADDQSSPEQRSPDERDAAVRPDAGGQVAGEVIEVSAPAPLDAASSTRRIDQTAVALTPVHSAEDLARLVPGLHTSRHAAEGKAQQYFLRGFDAVHGSDLAVTVAGIPINERSNVHGHGYVDLGFVIPEVVHTITADKGSFGLEHGDFATAGALDLTLGVAPELRGQRVGYEIGTSGRNRIVGIAAPPDADSASFIAAEAMSDPGFGRGRQSRRLASMAQWRLSPGDPRTFVEGFVAAYAAEFGEPAPLPLADIERGDIARDGSYTPDALGRSRRLLAALTVGGERERARGRLRLFGSWRDLTLDENFTGRLLDAANGDRHLQIARAHVVGLGADGAVELAPRWAVRAGALGIADRILQREDGLRADGTPWTMRRDVVADELVGGAHAGLIMSGQRLHLEAGARIDAFRIAARDRLTGSEHTAAATAVSPRLRGAVRVTQRLTATLALGRGLRSAEASAVASGGSAKPTRADSAELGLSVVPTAWSRVTIAGFGVAIDDELVFDHVAGTTLARNETRRLGAELSVALQPKAWLSARLDATAVDARFVESGAPVPSVPRLLATAELRAGRARGPRAAVLVTALGSRPLAHGARGDGWVLVDALLGWTFDRLDVELSVDNATDAEWNAGEFHYASWFDPDRPRSRLPALHVLAGHPIEARLAVTVHF